LHYAIATNCPATNCPATNFPATNCPVTIGFTDKILLNKWRDYDENYIDNDIVDQCQNLLLSIFGFTGFDYDFETSTTNDLSLALKDFLNIFTTTLCMPEFSAKIYFKFNSKYDQTI
jgi:hypothetical protein